MLNIAVCDDDPAELLLIKEYIARYCVKNDDSLTFTGFNCGEELLADYRKGKYDIIFLDVEMGKLDGIMTADRIRHIPDHDVNIMYVSNYPQYMQASFGVRAAQYLTKPISFETFESKIKDVLSYIEEEKDKTIELVISDERYYFKESDIITIETEGQKLLFTTENTSVLVRGKIRDYEKKCEKYMVSPNRSVLVNTRFIQKINGKDITLTNGRKIAISRQRCAAVKQEISKNLSARLDR